MSGICYDDSEKGKFIAQENRTLFHGSQINEHRAFCALALVDLLEATGCS